MTCDDLQFTVQAISGVGLLLGFLGSMLMANAYFQATDKWESVAVILGSIFGTAKARGAARLKDANPENVLRSLRGITLLVVSFVVQLVATGLQLLVTCAKAT